MSTITEVNNLLWMISHYKKLAIECFDIYSRLEDAYFMHDYNMNLVNKYQNRLDALFED